MPIAGRILNAVRPRRVLAALFIGGFAKEILSLFIWLIGTGWGLLGVASLRALLLASLALALDAGLIYLALHGLGSVLVRRRRKREAAAWHSANEGTDQAVALEEIEVTGAETNEWGREGGGDGRGFDHY